ncbi:DNA-directed RNA polymerase subunit D [Candidatus Bathyarchaeota archaeon]|nr:DNA-directed RNA polymerase subunit D [Candidatus Bathyarchaeota archaeon]
MEVKILNLDENNLKLVVKGVDSSFLNSIRRIILSEVPCMAIDDVIILENSSVMNDEFLSHRLGLIPIKTNLDAYKLPEECECKSELGCPLCRASFTLDVESKDGIKVVYSGDLIPEDPETVPVSDNIPIVKLSSGQRIRLEAYARLGRGKKHAKWQPVSLCVYKNYPHVKVYEELCDGCGECVEVCPEKILRIEEGKVKVGDVKECSLCLDCVKACKKEPKAIEVVWDKDSFILTLESTGALDPERIFLEAINIFNKKAESFIRCLEENKELGGNE